MTSKPCPICKEDDNGKPFRDENKVCELCWQEWKENKQFRAEVLARQQGLKVYGLNAYPSFSSGMYPDGAEVGDKIEKAFVSLCKVVGEPCPTENIYGRHDTTGTVPVPSHPGMGSISVFRYRHMTSSQAEALQTVYDLINAWGQLSYETGQQDGRNLLKQLARGELTTDEFAKEATESVRRIQSARRAAATRKLRKAQKPPKAKGKT